HFAVDQGIAWLKRRDRRDRKGALHLTDVEIRDADVADLALFLEPGHCRPAFLDLFVGHRSVDLVQVEGIDLEPPQAGLALAADRIRLEAVADLALLVPDHAALGEDVRPVAHSFEGSRYNLLRVSESIDGRGIDPVDAVVQRFPDRGHGVVVVLGAPGEFPTRAADGPRPETNRRDEQVRVS